MASASGSDRLEHMLEKRDADPALVSRLQQALSSSPLVRLAVLFGSAAHGMNRAESDVDVAILATEADFDDSTEAALSRRLALAARAEVDLIRIEGASTLLRWQIATKGVVLFEQLPGEFARFRARAASEYIDFAPALAYHGEIFRRRLIEQGRAR
jgi:predicted nucleotidyltransferase